MNAVRSSFLGRGLARIVLAIILVAAAIQLIGPCIYDNLARLRPVDQALQKAADEKK